MQPFSPVFILCNLLYVYDDVLLCVYQKEPNSESDNKQAESDGESVEKSFDITPLQEKEELLKKCEENLKELKVGFTCSRRCSLY